MLTPCIRPPSHPQLWEHIKLNNLQNPDDKREILNDEVLKGLFKCDRMGMFEMQKLLSPHFKTVAQNGLI